MSELTSEERVFLKELVKVHLTSVEKDGAVLISEDFPTFLASEEKYKLFLIDLMKKF